MHVDSIETIDACIYDFPTYYDLVYGSDWKAEFDFLEDCFEQYALLEVGRLWEPACGTGRLLYRLAAAGYEVVGNDLNVRAVDYCNARLERHGFAPSACVADMTSFVPRPPVDAAFNTINSFRHLASERQAEDHLRSVAAGLLPGGLYLLGVHLTPTEGEEVVDEEQWSARRGHLGVLSRMQSLDVDLRTRRERVEMTLDVYTPTRRFRLVEQIDFRTYTAPQMAGLLQRIDRLEIAATHDFSYRIDDPIQVDPRTEDVVYVLRKT